MIEPILSLALSMHSNKGVYALLLGSGVSRAAKIPTGYEIVNDLIRQIAAMKNENCEPDPEAWYNETYGEQPEYSKLLNDIVKSSSERQKLIRGYFEPTEEEREQGLKAPTTAHKAIAELAASGHIRVIITTNFDRLIEKALEDIGINPIPIYTADAIKGIPPLSHQEIFVIKLHGDYLDTRLKNSPKELEKYKPATNRLLDRIFDEFGLIECGWSAEWDTALRDALHRCKNRRYTTFWTSRGEPKGLAKDVIQQRRAQVVDIKDADSFFVELAEKVSALEEFDKPHPLSAKVAVITLKKYLVEERYKIQLHGLVTSEAEKVHAELSPEAFPASGINFSPEELVARLMQYESLTEILLSIMITGCYWGSDDHLELWTRCLERIANPSGGREGFVVWTDLRLYPALLLLYGGGIASLVAKQYRTFSSLLVKPKFRGEGKDKLLIGKLYPEEVLDSSHGNQMPQMNQRHTPTSDHLCIKLREPLREILPDDAQYEEYFDRFEYLRALVHADLFKTETIPARGPYGRFAWQSLGDRHIIKRTENEVKEAGADWPLFQVGLFDGSITRFELITKEFHGRLKQTDWW